MAVGLRKKLKSLMCRNHFFLLTSSKKYTITRACRRRLIGAGTIVVIAFFGMFPSAQSQPTNAAVGTPVSPDYVGLRTTRSYQPYTVGADGAKPAPVQVGPIDDELRSSYHISPFYKKTLTCAGVVVVGSDKVSD